MKSIIIFFSLFLFFAPKIISTITTSHLDNHKKKPVWQTNNEVMSLFEEWLIKHKKVYNALGEKAKRFEIFKNNLMFIDDHNSRYPNKTYTLGLNVFADLTDNEYQSKYLASRINKKRMSLASRNSDGVEYVHKVGSESLPDSVDWRSKGIVLPIENQGECGSCWAFSAICSVEGIYAQRTGKLISLSKQELVDCSPNSEGCDGGDYEDAFEYITFYGISSEQSYPYEAEDGDCQLEDKTKVVQIDGYYEVTKNDEKVLQKSVSDQIISVSIKANSTEFKLYTSGIFNGKCGDELDHSINIIGYGSEDNVDYWLVRNSWGTEWGEDGYIRIIRNSKNREGHCGIAIEPFYPFIKKKTWWC